MEKRPGNENNGSILGKIIKILFIITIFFALGYWCGKQNYTYQTAIDYLSSRKQKIKATIDEKSSEEEDTTERLTFHKSLKDKEEVLLPEKKVREEKEVETKKDKSAAKVFTLQLASFKKEDLAAEYIKNLSSLGLRPYMKKFDLKKQGVWYRVYLGEFPSKQDALEYGQHNLKSMEIYFLAVEK